MTRRVRLVAAAAVVAWAVASEAVAQAPRLLEPADRTGLLARFDYDLSLERLSGDDPQFRWDADFCGDFDIVASPRHRLAAAFAYEAILGDELQPFDPNQGNYAIELLGARRWGALEGAVVFHHTSRHRGDRPKLFGIAWNLLGLQGTWTRSGLQRSWQAQVRVTRAVMADFVDYTGELTAHALIEQRFSPRVTGVLRASAVARSVDGDDFGRGNQTGGRAEVALRVSGLAADLEIFGGVERRIDADPLALEPRTWALAGLRLQGAARRR